MLLSVLVVVAGVADVYGGHADDLPLVRGIGQDLLVSRHRRVEDDLPDRLPPRPESLALEDAPVGERQQRAPGAAHAVPPSRTTPPSITIRPPTIVIHGAPTRRHPANGVFRPFE